MSRWVLFFISIIFGLGLIFLGLQMPAHLRAVDGIVLQNAGTGTPSLIAKGLALVQDNQLGAAQLLAAAAGNTWFKDSHTLGEAVDELARRQPALKILGRPEPGRLGALLESNSAPKPATGQPVWRAQSFTEIMVRSEHRTKALELLQASPRPLAPALLSLRSLTNTVLFPPSSSPSGQAFDTALGIAGLLAEAGHISSDLSKAMLVLTTEATTGNPQPLEQILMDLLSLGRHFNWGQLATFVEPIKDPETLRVLAGLVQRGDSVPVIFAAVCLTGNAAGVAKYLTTFSETGLNDLRLSLIYGAGGVNEILQRNQRLCDAKFCDRLATLATAGKLSGLASAFTPKTPALALAAKWVLYLLGGFFVAAAFHFARHVTPLERPLELRGFHLAREFLFALGFLLVVLLLSEPFLAQANQKEVTPFRLRLPMVGSAVPAGVPGAPSKIMNSISLLTMLLFFVLQALLYVASLVKLAEIRRQPVMSHMKLKLLDNEDHLFDAGLYLGFLGTIISLILVSLGVFKQPSLMAAYSSTCFGILFVVIFKILNLRGARRQLLLKAELETPARLTSPAAAPIATPL